MVWILAAALAAGITGDVRVGVVALFLLGWFVRRRRTSWVEGLCAAATAMAFGLYGWLSIASSRQDARRVAAAADPAAGDVRVEGWVSGFPKYRYTGMAFEFKTRVRGVECTILAHTDEFEVCYGDSLRLTGRWKGPRRVAWEEYETRLVGMGVSGELRVRPGGLERLAGAGGDWMERNVLFPWHERARTELSRGLGARAGIPIAVLLGETGYLDRRLSDAFRTLGITHLIALSGQHLYFVAGAVVVLLKVLRRRSSVLLLAAVSLYVAVVGFIVSLFRSFVMVVILSVASLFKRPIDPVTALADAFVVVLLFYPQAFFSVGFQLSFLATLALLLCARRLRPPKSKSVGARAAFAIRSSLEVSVFAQLFVTPIIIHYFGRVSVLGPVGTLIFVVPVAFLLLSSGVSALLPVAVPAAGPPVFAALGCVVGWFERALLTSAKPAPGMVSPVAPIVWLYYTGLALLILPRARGARFAGAAILASSFVFPALRGELF